MKYPDYLAAAGILSLWLGFPNNFLELPFLIILWPVCTALCGIAASTMLKAFFYGWLISFFGGIFSLYWLYLPVQNVGGLPFAAAMLCAIFIVACLALQGAFYAACARFIKQMPVWRKTLILVFGWYLLEYIFAVILGFPWLQMAGALAVWPFLLQHADIAGAWLAASLWLLPCFLLALPPVTNNLRKKIFASIIFCLFLCGYNWIMLTINPVNLNPSGKDSVNSLFVEGNVDQNQKWIPAFQRWNLDLYISLTQKGLENTKNKPLIIWPETAMPFFFEKMPVLSSALKEAVKKFDCPLLFGAPGIEHIANEPEEAIYNRAFLLNPEGEIIGHYDKEHLVPFGEYLPSWLNFKFLENLLQGAGVYKPGNTVNPLRYDTLALGMLICYESIFPWLAQERVAAGANILADISNDGWFGLSPAARQHLFLSIPRCLEQNRWLLRATNTGISAVADNRGRIIKSGSQFKAGTMQAAAKLIETPGIYSYYSAYMPFIIAMLFFILILPAVSLLQKNWFLINASNK